MKQKEDSGLLDRRTEGSRLQQTGGLVRQILDGRWMSPPPVWLMRQAGRYLPEYRAVRAEAGGFLDLCFDPLRAAEVTLQPVRRFDVDAAILFSDILVVPLALGRAVRFAEGEGPELDPVDAGAIARLRADGAMECLAPILETVRRVREALPAEKSLVGFCGAPWTVATYMIAGRGSADQAAARQFARNEPAAMRALIDVLVETSVEYLAAQLEAGADVVQIFDTWAGALEGEELRCWSIEPVARIVTGLRQRVANAKVIAFPKGVGAALTQYAETARVDGLSLDPSVTAGLGQRLQERVAIQGNLDPQILRRGGAALDAAIDRIVTAFSGGRFIFNLGHGILPDTPVEHVARLVARVRGGERGERN